MPSRYVRRLAVALLAQVLASAADAQSLTGTVRDSLSRLPVPGVVVMLVDSAGGTITRGLSNGRGDYGLPLRADARRLKVLRIGFSPRDLALPPRTDPVTRLDIILRALPSMIQPVRVLANANCSTRRDRAAALGLWEQARAGLLATIVARESRPAKMHRIAFDKIMRAASDRIETMRVRADSSDSSTTSFVAAHPAKDLVRFGFATDSLASGTYFGPDADVLLDEFFVAGYCFQIATPERSRPTQVGLRFIPADHQRGRVDIDGALWIDTVARELREVEYRYVGVERGAEQYRPGGNISFHLMPNGVPAIDHWFIRVVSAQQDSVVGPSGSLKPRDYLYAEEIGGELAHAQWSDGLAWSAPLGTARIHAVLPDGRPAAGSIVALIATPYFGVADANGMITIGDLVPGPYEVRMIDPRIAGIGIGFPTPLKFVSSRDTTPVLNLKWLTTEQTLTQRCVANHQWKVGDSTFVFGRVLTSDGKPIDKAHVQFATRAGEFTAWSWSDVYYDTGTNGLFEFCGSLPLGTEILVRVRRGGMSVFEEVFTLASDLLVVKAQERPAP